VSLDNPFSKTFKVSSSSRSEVPLISDSSRTPIEIDFSDETKSRKLSLVRHAIKAFTLAYSTKLKILRDKISMMVLVFGEWYFELDIFKEGGQFSLVRKRA
jgi:hypothetical protein